MRSARPAASHDPNDAISVQQHARLALEDPRLTREAVSLEEARRVSVRSEVERAKAARRWWGTPAWNPLQRRLRALCRHPELRESAL